MVDQWMNEGKDIIPLKVTLNNLKKKKRKNKNYKK